MTVKTFTSFITILFVQYNLHAQGAQSSIYSSINNGWQFTLSPTLSSKQKIKPDYSNTSGLNVYSKPVFGFNSQISRHFNINDKRFFAIGGSFNLYKADIGYDLSTQFFDSIRLKNDIPYDYNNYGLTFHFSASAKYYLKICGTDRTSLFSNVGLGLNYMMASFYGYGSDDNVLSFYGVFNENRKPFLSGTAGISLRHQISKRLYFVSGLTYDYSPTTTFRGKYNIYAKSGILTGNIEKKFSQLNFDIGLFRSFMATPYVSKRDLKYENDSEMPDFYGKGWGFSFASYVVPKFKVTQNPSSASTTFYSKPRISYKAGLTNLTPLSKKSFLKTAIAYGDFRVDEGLKIEQAESITGKAIDIYEKYSEGMRYVALSIQYGRVLLSNENQALTLAIGGSFNQIRPAGWESIRREFDGKDGRFKTIYEVEGDDYGNIDLESRPFLSGKLDISYWSKLSDNFSFYLSPFMDISNKHVLVGDYKIYGRNNTYAGHIYKKFHQYGISTGIFWMLPRKIRIAK